MDGAGACSGLLNPDDRIIEVDGVPTASLQQVTKAVLSWAPSYHGRLPIVGR